jgi:hypothetical protein
MDTFPPQHFEWNGEAMTPLHPRRADKTFVVGQRYSLVQYEERSSASHNHEFAWLKEAWLSLPERLADRFPSPEHLRKWALIRAGYSDSHTITCRSKAEATRVAAFIRPIDEFAVVIVQGTTVTRCTAKSQSKRAMGAKEFYESKERIMEVVARMLNVEPQELPRARAA